MCCSDISIYFVSTISSSSLCFWQVFLNPSLTSSHPCCCQTLLQKPRADAWGSVPGWGGGILRLRCTASYTLCERMWRDAILDCEGPDYTCSQHGGLLADRWLKHESAFKTVKAQGLRFFMLAHDKQEMCVLALCECYVCVCVCFCVFNICNRVPLTVHVWVSLGVCWAQNQQNATGMRISVALPWQQTNARADGSSRIKAQRSSQRGKKNEGPD